MLLDVVPRAWWPWGGFPIAVSQPFQVRYYSTAPVDSEDVDDAPGQTIEAGPNADASLNGATWGRYYGGNAWQMATAEGVDVHLVTPIELAKVTIGGAASPGKAVYGLTQWSRTDWTERANVYIDRTLPTEEQTLTLAHELSHVTHRGGNWTEPMADAWSRAFIRAAVSE